MPPWDRPPFATQLVANPTTGLKPKRAPISHGAPPRRSVCLTAARRHEDGPGSKPKLKNVGGFGSPRAAILACILAGLYMYPMIFKPLFGFGTSAEEQMEKMKDTGLDPSKTRPSNMPEWTSPFGPPRGKTDGED